MVRAILICSDDGCTAVYEAYGPLEEVELLACECGCGLAIVGWPAPAEERDSGVEMNLLAA